MEHRRRKWLGEATSGIKICTEHHLKHTLMMHIRWRLHLLSEWTYRKACWDVHTFFFFSKNIHDISFLHVMLGLACSNSYPCLPTFPKKPSRKCYGTRVVAAAIWMGMKNRQWVNKHFKHITLCLSRDRCMVRLAFPFVASVWRIIFKH